MKKILTLSLVVCSYILMSCNNIKEEPATTEAGVSQAGQSGVQDDLSQRNVVQVAVGSEDHTTLVKAVQAAELVNALSNAGPFTVFAPTNAAFDNLPAGTVEGLLAPEEKDDLADILQYHVSLGVFKAENLTDGQIIGQVNGGNITITRKDGKTMVNGTATIVASVPASNGMIHVIDGVLLPK
ncbi:fasciclin domain-containing protein [Daejeonella sp.]|uniref:fasciclin domain-containing protein n=1 Tax=Daejeonella sp. TaxID=2805397 RepID=UPI00398303DE